MTEDTLSKEDSYNGYLTATTTKEVVLYKYVAQTYELKDARYTKNQEHLCLYCDLFFQYSRTADNSGNSIIESNTYPHWPKLYLLVAAAAQGCHICQLFLSQLTIQERESILKFEETNSGHGTIQLHSLLHRRGPQLIRMRFAAPPEILASDQDRIVVDLALDQTEASPCSFDNPNENKLDRPLATWEVAFSWIINCVVNHSGCRNSLLSSQKRPRRLIYVGDDDDAVRLCETSNLDSEALYVTLSHCWGPKGVSFKLQKINESSLLKRIPMSKISKTFQHAIAFTRRLRLLGVRYIWIDALCILQDSTEDWEDQAIIMGEIYGGAFCNLAACAASDGNSGLYPNVSGVSRRICTVTFGANSVVSGTFKVRNKDIMGNGVRDSTILSRGWCVQELALAPRVLYFGRDHAAWDCSTLLAEETAPMRQMMREDGYGFRGRKFRFWNKDLGDWSGAIRTDVDAETRALEHYHAWMNIVKEYSRCALTCHTDRLFAISGVARLIHAGVGKDEEYVAGLWKKNLALHLVWHISGSPKNYQLWPFRAPSWSWASVEASVYNHLTNAEAIAKCVSFVEVSAEVELRNPADAFGFVRSAVLHVEGPVFKAFLGPRGSTTAQDLCKLFVEVDEKGNRVEEVECITPHPVNLDFNYPGSELVTVYCLLIMTTAFQDHLAGLLLVPHVDSSIRGCYIRVGVSHSLPKRLLDLARGPWKLGEEAYEEKIEGGDYRISII